ncbi:phosphotransacetylase [Paucidesulfovibrio gracilis DSM 16080]|uniref:Phosphate acetyltransferase n=1 Tax=Paucidesulfovibrio gracilis DSM 16080 TaxID=1121449 RepID=A0A1T4XZK1_9BACT|nr:phosphate acetyltransferase [Paucidesulfovibrio gracilis]SKA94992.1 phosphotransacetylase [Paucidesulfovibrio gracilis DSM 16080]
MSKNLYVTATGPRSGKSAIALGLMQLLSSHLRKVAFFRPIIQANEGRDHDISLILSHFNLNQDYETAYGFTLSEARERIGAGQYAQLQEEILEKYKRLEAQYDFVLCEGTDFQGQDSAFEFDLNADICANLGAPAMLVCNGNGGQTPRDITRSAQLNVEALEDKSVDVTACIVNKLKADTDVREITQNIRCVARCDEPLLVYAIPEVDALGKPTVGDVGKWLNAKALFSEEGMDNLAQSYIIAAMHISHFLEYLEPGGLIITPGDRSDIILSSLASRLSSNYPDISGIVLTGDLEPSESVKKLIMGWTGVPVPVLSVKESTFPTVERLSMLYGRIDPEDDKRIATALGAFERHVDVDELRNRLVTRRSNRVTPKMFEYGLVEKARTNKQRIVLPEGSGDRILRAADILLRRGVADITLLGNPDEIRSQASRLGLDIGSADVVLPEQSKLLDEYAQTYYELRQHKGIREVDARDRIIDPTYFATMMVHKGHADGMVSGSVTTTAATIRPAFEFIKTKPSASIVSSVFLMCLKDRVLVYGDCAVNPNPNAQQLAEIAIGSAETASIFGVEPRVAMLSYSTGSSGKGADVEKVIEATRLAKEKAPDLLIEGPIQYDAAIDAEVAKTKLPFSEVAGKATVFVFPDLNTGNNTYKAVQRASGAVAIGPVLQGLNKPVNDLSRGCTVPDIVNTVAITAIQAQAEKGLL